MNKQYSNCFSQREIILADHFDLFQFDILQNILFFLFSIPARY